MQASGELGVGTQAGLFLYGAGRLVGRLTAGYEADPAGGYLVNDTLDRAAFIKRLEGLRLARDRLQACVVDVAADSKPAEGN